MKFYLTDDDINNAPPAVNVRKISRYNGVVKYLVLNEDVAAMIKVISYWQGVNKEFQNVGVKPYRGRNYNPAKFQWVTVG